MIRRQRKITKINFLSFEFSLSIIFSKPFRVILYYLKCKTRIKFDLIIPFEKMRKYSTSPLSLYFEFDRIRFLNVSTIYVSKSQNHLTEVDP